MLDDISSDNATNFRGNLTTEFLKRLECCPRLLTLAYPQACGLVERMVSSIKSAISKVAIDHPKQWYIHIIIIIIIDNRGLNARWCLINARWCLYSHALHFLGFERISKRNNWCTSMVVNFWSSTQRAIGSLKSHLDGGKGCTIESREGSRGVSSRAP